MNIRSFFTPTRVALLLLAVVAFFVMSQIAAAAPTGSSGHAAAYSAGGVGQVDPARPREIQPIDPEEPVVRPDPEPPAEPGPDLVPDPDLPPPPGPGPAPGPGAGGTQICASDLNGNGDAADPGEIAACVATTAAGWQCPLQQVTCVPDAQGQFSCPLGPQHGCAIVAGGSVPSCSPNQCADPGVTPIEEVPPIDDPGTPADGPIDANGNCLGRIEIFSGRGMRCRPPGLSVTFASCCRDKGKIIKDGMGSQLSSISTKIAVAKGVFNGMSAAFTAFRAGATASQAASTGASALIAGFDPTSLAVSLAINFMIEFLFNGCDQQDMETAMLRGSGMCHEVGSYCTSSFLGICLEKAKGHCCFNTKLGRIIQEQGRHQLKSFNAVGWGTPKKPLCRGFTPEEFQALDFSKMDLSEYYAEIEARAQDEIQIQMKDKIDAYLKAIGE
jgi:conjugal transfer mating pair stabilization protein TraN